MDKTYAKPGGPTVRLRILVQPFDAPGCGRQIHYRLLTPAEMARRVNDWIGERLGFGP